MVAIGKYVDSRANRIYRVRKDKNQACCLLKWAERGGNQRALPGLGAFETFISFQGEVFCRLELSSRRVESLGRNFGGITMWCLNPWDWGWSVDREQLFYI